MILDLDFYLYHPLETWFFCVTIALGILDSDSECHIFY